MFIRYYSVLGVLGICTIQIRNPVDCDLVIVAIISNKEHAVSLMLHFLIYLSIHLSSTSIMNMCSCAVGSRVKRKIIGGKRQ